MMQPIPMSVPLWGLVIFVAWTMIVVMALIVVRLKHLAKGGSVQDFGMPNDASLLWRLLRVQCNLAENLPLYLSVVVLLVVRESAGSAVNALAGVYIVFRLLHSAIHLAGMNPLWRVYCLSIQFICLAGLSIAAIRG
jgi:uncharacterized MAPEG superfamily protein